MPIAASYPLEHAGIAHERLAKGHVLGKIVLRVKVYRSGLALGLLQVQIAFEIAKDLIVDAPVSGAGGESYRRCTPSSSCKRLRRLLYRVWRLISRRIRHSG